MGTFQNYLFPVWQSSQAARTCLWEHINPESGQCSDVTAAPRNFGGQKKTINIGNKSPRTGPASFQSTWWFLLFLFVTEFSSNLIFLGGEWGDLRVCRVYSSADPSLTSSRFRDSKKASAPLGTFSSLNESKCNNRVDFWTGKVKFQLNCNSTWTLFNVT